MRDEPDLTVTPINWRQLVALNQPKMTCSLRETRCRVAWLRRTDPSADVCGMVTPAAISRLRSCFLS